jgi:hypothetical protein
MHTAPAYDSTAAASERVAWKLDDILAEDDRFDFGQPFLPDRLVGAEELDFLSAEERLTLNHIRAHGYLCLFGLVEEFILPYVLDQARARLDAPSAELRSLLQFASEEAKHIALFERFRTAFERGFARPLGVIGPPAAIAEHVRRHSELGVGLLILHIEWMTQRHYVDMVRDDRGLEPRFASLLHHHWLEESQHARIDEWIVERLAAELPEAQRAAAVGDYLALCAFLDAGLKDQVTLDLDGLERAIGRRLPDRERDAFIALQHQSQRRTYLGAGISHPRLVRFIDRIAPAAADAIARAADEFR